MKSLFLIILFIFNVLNPDYVDRREMSMNTNFELKNKNCYSVKLDVDET